VKHLREATIVLFIILITIHSLSCSPKPTSGCLTGAFLADKPSKQDIVSFNDKYGKKPFLVMVFIDWDNFVDKKVIEDVYSQDCVLFVTWEPWHANRKEPINYDGLLSGEYDQYINEFAKEIKQIKGDVFLRFAHEMNGNWYPWSGTKIGKDKFVANYRYVKDAFDKIETSNVRWVFSINWEDIPQENNHFSQYYPGDDYVDFFGIDGYNWGNTKSWSRWMSFSEIFDTRYNEVVNNFEKPVLISEFSSTSSGGDKTVWIKKAMTDIKRLKNIKGFVLFNVDKETDWSFPLYEKWSVEFKKQLEAPYFKDNGGSL